MKSTVAVLVILFLLSACSGLGPKPAAQSPPAKHLAIIFVPGFKGSTLVEEKSGRRLWVTRRQALFNGDTLMLNPEQWGMPPCEPLKVSGVLDYIPIVPGLTGLDPYRGFLQEMEERYGREAKIVPFAYDWRQDNVQTVHELSETIEQLHAAGYEKIWLIGHSMGGLITSYYLRYGDQSPEDAQENWAGAQRVDKVVLAGVPFSGVMVIFKNLQFGSKTFLNNSLLSAQALGSFPSTYELLPAPVEPTVFEYKGGISALPIYDVDLWKKNGWGILHDQAQDGKYFNARYEFLKTSLARAQLFWQRLYQPLQNSPAKTPDVINIRGVGQQALSRAVWLDEKKPPQFVFEDDRWPKSLPALPFALIEQGDYALPSSTAYMPPAFQKVLRIRNLDSEKEHGNLFNGEKTRRALTEFFQEGHAL